MIDAAARELDEYARACVQARGTFSLVLAGGSTPADLYRALANNDDALPWAATQLWFGDERCVPPTHHDSNYRMAHETLIGPLGLPADRVHRMRGELPPGEAADAYEAEIREAFALAPGELPHFDLVLLGIGEDGHTASLFPDTTALGVHDRVVAPNYVPKLDAHRITLSMPCLCAAQRVWILVAGARKAEIVAAVLGGPQTPARYPVQQVRLPESPVIWWLDEPAAAQLSP
ncbi:MAG: 6-phosphogluconolactonase [Deltaproteobacteria bacterium]|nr:6-phosphogluconolactonase [Nannocystaceae bacterium]